MENFEQFKKELLEKWLDFYEVNQDWLENFAIYQRRNQYNFIYDGTQFTANRHVDFKFVLGTLATLEPRLRLYLDYFVILSDDLERIFDLLGLIVDSDLIIEYKKEKRKAQSESSSQAVLDPEYQEAQEFLNTIRQEIDQNPEIES